VLAPDITGVIYQGGAFGEESTLRVSRALSVYAAGLGFFSFMKVMVPWFQAQNDMKTPLRVSVTTVCLNAALNVLAVALLPVEWRHVGLAASTVACSATGCALLVLKARRGGPLGLGAAVRPVAAMAGAACAMAAALAILRPFAAPLGRLPALAALIAAGAAVYAAISLAVFRGRVRAMLRRPRSRA